MSFSLVSFSIRINSKRKEFVAVAPNSLLGEPTYFQKGTIKIVPFPFVNMVEKQGSVPIHL